MTTANKPAASNVAGSIEKIISSAMNEATKGENRTAQLVVAMFNAEATYSQSAILSIFRKERADRTAAIDSMLDAASDTFANLVDLYDRMTDKDYRKTLDDEAKAKNAFEAQAIFLKIRAARKLFETALAATYHLRDVKSKTVKTNNVGAGSLVMLAPSKEFAGEYVPQRVATSKCAAAGTTAINAKIGKAKPAASKAKNPSAGNSMADAAKALASAVTSMKPETKAKGIADVFSDGLEKDALAIFKEFFAMQFVHNGHVNMVEVKEFIVEQFGENVLAKPVKETKAA